MHGRLKVKTTAEQQEEKRKEREKKLQLFQAGYRRVSEKRENQEYDDEALSVVSGLLQANPDLYTLWNFRKEILLHLQESRSKDDFQAQCQEEMILTEACLRKNPKSYGAWHHRGWILGITPEPNWTREIGLCNKFLEIDERNFHCWDHRRLVCQLSDVKAPEELNFTMKKIEANFSNYSAWHYRSSLLPLVHPGPKEEYRSILEDVILKEYELVQNAAFTDPADQSAWFYHRWLLGRAEKKLDILYVHSCPSKHFVTVALTKPVLLNENNSLSFIVNNSVINTPWVNLNAPYASTLYKCEDSNILSNSSLNVVLNACGNSSTINIVLKNEIVHWKCDTKKELYISELSAAAGKVLQQELESCQQLMELEPENKWTILTNVLLMQALDNKKYEPEVMKHLEKLTTVDSSRKNYYNDLRSKYIVENKIESLDQEAFEISLVNQSLHYIPHLDHMAFLRVVDFSRNKIVSLKNFSQLINVEKLNLSENQIKSCTGLGKLDYLTELNLKNNLIEDESDIEDLKLCKSIKEINLFHNPISLNKDWSLVLSSDLSKVVLE